MKSERLRPLLGFALGCVLLALLGWFVSRFFEERWEVRESPSQASLHNRMLGATRLLEVNQHPVTSYPTLSLALLNTPPAGTMILPDNGGSMLKEQVDRVLNWVAQGNTLIVSPRWAQPLDAKPEKEDESKKDEEDAPRQTKLHPAVNKTIDSIGARFDVSSTTPFQDGKYCRDPRLGKETDVRHNVGAAPGTPGMPGVPNAPPGHDAPDGAQAAAVTVDCTTIISLPGAAHGLRIDGTSARLQSPADAGAGEEAPTTPAATQVLADEQGRAVRIFQYGTGRVVFVAHNFFDNNALPRYDHAELLLGLAGLNPRSARMLIVQRFDIASWPQLLWANIPFVLSGLALFLVLLLWAAVRRFGPMLPDPDDRRRSLIEHVDASGRWLWKSEIGRQILIAAMRRTTEKTLDRRAPELRKLTSDLRIAKLAELCKMKPVEIERALLDSPARVPAEFTHQIQTLQLLRKHYER